MHKRPDNELRRIQYVFQIADTALNPAHSVERILSRALAAEQDLILCDEVTSALDTVVAAVLLDLISELRRELGLSVLFISHDMHAVRAVCDNIVVMKSGRIVTQLAREDYDKPTSELYFERLKRAVPELRQGWLDEHEEILKAE